MRALERGQHENRNRRADRSRDKEARYKGEQRCLGVAHEDSGDRVGRKAAQNAGAEYLACICRRQLRTQLVCHAAQQRADHRAGEREQAAETEPNGKDESQKPNETPTKGESGTVKIGTGDPADESHAAVIDWSAR